MRQAETLLTGQWFLEQIADPQFTTDTESAIGLIHLSAAIEREGRRAYRAAIAESRTRGLNALERAREEAIYSGDWKAWWKISVARISAKFHYYVITGLRLAGRRPNAALVSTLEPVVRIIDRRRGHV